MPFYDRIGTRFHPCSTRTMPYIIIPAGISVHQSITKYILQESNFCTFWANAHVRFMPIANLQKGCEIYIHV